MMQVEVLTKKVSSYAMPLGVMVAALFFFYWYVFAGSLGNALWRSIAVLLISYPLILTRAMPAVLTWGIARAKRAHIRFRNEMVFERIVHTTEVIFTKTGTLTIGKPDITDFVVFDDTLPLSEALYLAASLESKSAHPLARAIVEKGKLLTRALATPFEYKEVAGMGVSGIVNGTHVEIGNLSFLEELVETVHGQDIGVGRFQHEGKTVIYMFVEKKLAALIACKDALRPFAKETIAAIVARGKKVALLTGDNKKTAEAFARELGISAVYSTLPSRDTTGVVAVVGSGDMHAHVRIMFGVDAVSWGGGDWDVWCAGDDLKAVASVFTMSMQVVRAEMFIICLQCMWYIVAYGFLLLR